jgi:DNA-directed RNA polymerase specialized sigma24 family protein
MTLEELYLKEKVRIEKLSRRYARMFRTEKEDLFQEGFLALAETYAKYAYKLPDGELLKVSHRMVNRKIYKYAQNEYKYKTQSIGTKEC